MGRIIEQVESYLEYCEKVRGMSETTMGMKRNVLGRFVEITGLNDLGSLTNEVFNEWMMHETMRGVSARSINMYNAIVVAMVRYYREGGMSAPLNLNLVRKLKEGSVRRNYYTAKEIEEVIRVAGERDELIVRIMFETGMRIAEVAKLRLGNIGGRRVRFIGKGRKPREVYISAKTLVLLNSYVMNNRVADYLWGTYLDGGNGEPPTTNTVRNWLRKCFFRAGYMDFYPHALRHSFATDLQLKGATVAEIKEMIGHANVATTERYLHGFDGRMKELFDKYR